MARRRVTPRINPSALCLSTPDEPEVYKTNEINFLRGLKIHAIMMKGGARLTVLM